MRERKKENVGCSKLPSNRRETKSRKHQYIHRLFCENNLLVKRKKEYTSKMHKISTDDTKAKQWPG